MAPTALLPDVPGAPPRESPEQRPGLARRVLASRWLRYFVAFELALVGVVLAALSVVPASPMRGVIVGMAISLIGLSLSLLAAVAGYWLLRR